MMFVLVVFVKLCYSISFVDLIGQLDVTPR